DYTHRSYEKELLDGNDIPFGDVVKNMKELDFINTWLGGHIITLAGFKKLFKNQKEISVCEIGCGGGDNLNAIYRFCKKKNIKATFEGIDINPDCIAFAKTNSPIENVNFIVSDYRKIKFKEGKPDIIFSSLFCHHFTNDELAEMLLWMKENAIIGFFINDLHRHPLAYNFIRSATKLFSKSYLVKNDAPLSVLRGFNKREWRKIFETAGINNYSIKWKWAFRYLIVCPNQ
ncbi:MAG: methyltransferase domain-containing protein, partial [Bacteroidota bacterium]|nr:methyltransferase domain-containing protein [Bacteroidota bacterium]